MKKPEFSVLFDPKNDLRGLLETQIPRCSVLSVTMIYENDSIIVLKVVIEWKVSLINTCERSAKFKWKYSSVPIGPADAKKFKAGLFFTIKKS